MSFRLIKEMIAKRLGASGIIAYDANPGGRVFRDADLRDLRPGGYVDFTGAMAAFVLATEAKSIFVAPTELRQQIIAHGVLKDGAFEIHRFYLANLTDDSGYVLQVTTKDGNPVDGEVKLFQQITTFEPASKEEWDAFLTGEGDIPPLIGGIKLDWESNGENIEYQRVWGSDAQGNGPLKIDRRALHETIGTGNGPTRSIDSEAMLYCRMLGDTPEWLYICSLHDSSSEERWIEAYVGLTLRRGEFSAT